MSDPNLDEFERLFPIAQFLDQDVLASVRPLEVGVGAMGQGIVASAQCRRFGPPNAFALAFATRGGDRIGPFLLTPRVAAEIRKALVDSGF
jgi:hypothetical protein